jgi:hypothetical protein
MKANRSMISRLFALALGGLLSGAPLAARAEQPTTAAEATPAASNSHHESRAIVDRRRGDLPARSADRGWSGRESRGGRGERRGDIQRRQTRALVRTRAAGNIAIALQAGWMNASRIVTPAPATSKRERVRSWPALCGDSAGL